MRLKIGLSGSWSLTLSVSVMVSGESIQHFAFSILDLVEGTPTLQQSSSLFHFNYIPASVALYQANYNDLNDFKRYLRLNQGS